MHHVLCVVNLFIQRAQACAPEPQRHQHMAHLFRESTWTVIGCACSAHASKDPPTTSAAPRGAEWTSRPKVYSFTRRTEHSRFFDIVSSMLPLQQGHSDSTADREIYRGLQFWSQKIPQMFATIDRDFQRNLKFHLRSQWSKQEIAQQIKIILFSHMAPILCHTSGHDLCLHE